MSTLAAQSGIGLSGGDISRADKLGFCLTVWGAPSRGAERAAVPFLRRGAGLGETLFLVGPSGLAGAGLGLGRAGLLVLEKEGRAARASYPEACKALLDPEPMLAAGAALAVFSAAHGNCVRGMDLSDGLLRDLPRLLHGSNPARQNAPGAELTLTVAELHAELKALAARRVFGGDVAGVEREALSLALIGGDEYALLAACPEAMFQEVCAALECLHPAPAVQVIGRTVAKPGLYFQGCPLSDFIVSAGFDHFAP